MRKALVTGPLQRLAQVRRLCSDSTVITSSKYRYAVAREMP